MTAQATRLKVLYKIISDYSSGANEVAAIGGSGVWTPIPGGALWIMQKPLRQNQK